MGGRDRDVRGVLSGKDSLNLKLSDKTDLVPAESSEIKFEIGHVLFIDIVGYSKLLINEQSEQIEWLGHIVRGTEQVRLADAEGKVLLLPTGDGGALVFRNSLEAPVKCALEISHALKNYPALRVRMGIHSGPVNEITDLNEQATIAGAGINIAQRVMDCGDAGHILLSKRVADDLGQYPQWCAILHDLGECEVKHGVRLHIFNLCSGTFGEASLPARILAQHTEERSVAVLPFVDLSESKNQEYLCDGLSEELIHALAKMPGLRVAARTSAFSFKGRDVGIREIAKQLGVSNVIEGSLRRSGDRIRVTAQLINARTGFHLWSDTIRHEMRDVFELEDEITHAIVDALKVKFSDSAPVGTVKGDPEANDLYFQGLYFSNKSGEEGLRKGLKCFQAALDNDPKISRAWTGIARWLMYG